MHLNVTTRVRAKPTLFWPNTGMAPPARSPSPTSCTTAVSRTSPMADRSSTQLVRGGAVELAKPVIELRELVETFRSHHVVVEGWQDIVRRAIATMTAFDRGCPGQFPALVRIVTGLDVLLEVGWS